MVIKMTTIKIINPKCQKIPVEIKERIQKINMKKVVVKKINSRIKAAQLTVLKVAVQRICTKEK